jgi:hypothetical protein
MQIKTRAAAITASLTVAGVVVGATLASAASSSSTPAPAVQSGKYVFACVNPNGGIDYLEFRKPLPHQCWFRGESLWYWDAVPLAEPSPTATPTPTARPTPTATPAPTSSATPTPTPASTASSTSTATATP